MGGTAVNNHAILCPYGITIPMEGTFTQSVNNSSIVYMGGDGCYGEKKVRDK